MPDPDVLNRPQVKGRGQKERILAPTLKRISVGILQGPCLAVLLVSVQNDADFRFGASVTTHARPQGQLVAVRVCRVIIPQRTNTNLEQKALGVSVFISQFSRVSLVLWTFLTLFTVLVVDFNYCISDHSRPNQVNHL